MVHLIKLIHQPSWLWPSELAHPSHTFWQPSPSVWWRTGRVCACVLQLMSILETARVPIKCWAHLQREQGFCRPRQKLLACFMFTSITSPFSIKSSPWRSGFDDLNIFPSASYKNSRTDDGDVTVRVVPDVGQSNSQIFVVMTVHSCDCNDAIKINIQPASSAAKSSGSVSHWLPPPRGGRPKKRIAAIQCNISTKYCTCNCAISY